MNGRVGVLSRRSLGGLLLLGLAVASSRVMCDPEGPGRAQRWRPKISCSCGGERRPEARGWLESNGSPAALASNRFGSTREALAFVNRLYRAGAVRVAIDNINDDAIEMAEGGPYADALHVHLPADPARRRELFAIANPEFAREGFAIEADIGQDYLDFWWD